LGIVCYPHVIMLRLLSTHHELWVTNDVVWVHTAFPYSFNRAKTNFISFYVWLVFSIQIRILGGWVVNVVYKIYATDMVSLWYPPQVIKVFTHFLSAVNLVNLFGFFSSLMSVNHEIALSRKYIFVLFRLISISRGYRNRVFCFGV